MDQVRRVIVLSGLSAGLAAIARPGRADNVGDGMNRLAIAYNDDYAPYSYTDQGEVKGILPDLLDPLLGTLANLKVTRVGLPWRRVHHEVQNGISDAFCTFASEERQRYTLFHKLPVVTLRPHLFFAADSPMRRTIEQVARREELMALRLVDLSGNQWAEQNLKDFPNIVYMAGHDGVFRQIMAGRGDVHVSLSPVVTRWRIKRLGLSNDQIKSIPAPFVAGEVPFHLLVRKTHPRAAEVLTHLDDMLRRPATQRLMDEVMRRYA